MALIIITIIDNAEGDTDVSFQAEPMIDANNPDAMLSGAQVVALNMLRAAKGGAPVKHDRGMIQLIN
jgi:hypothetical protein